MDMIRGETIEKLDDLFSLDKEIFKKVTFLNHEFSIVWFN